VDAAQVRPLLPAGPGCRAVVTSRNALVGLVAVEGVDLLQLDLLTPAEAHDLLSGRLGAPRVAAEPRATQHLIDLCARLPLALSVASARAAIQPHLPLSALVAQLTDGRGRLDALDCADAGISVRAVFSWSYHRLDDGAARVFRLLGLAPGPDISEPAAAGLTGLPRARVATILDELVRAQLLIEPTPRRFAFHDLLRAYAAETAQAAESVDARTAAVRRLFDHYLRMAYAGAQLINTAKDHLDLATGPDEVAAQPMVDRDAAWAWFESEHQVLLAAVDGGAALGLGQHSWQLAWCLADYLHQSGFWHDWADSQRTALAASIGCASAPGQARSHQYLGYALAKLNDHADSRNQLYAALRMFEQLDDADGRAGTHMMVAIGMERQQRYPEALPHAGAAVALRRASGQPGPLANALNALGWYHALNGQHEQAVRYCRQALAVHHELGNDNGAAATWDSLGYAHHHLGQPAEARHCYQQAIDLHRRLGDRGSMAGNLTGLGDVHASAGDQAAARQAWQEALSILDELGRPDAARLRERLA
jgi:tetratricopeptide (TPR) repeat protein